MKRRRLQEKEKVISRFSRKNILIFPVSRQPLHRVDPAAAAAAARFRARFRDAVSGAARGVSASSRRADAVVEACDVQGGVPLRRGATEF